MNEKRSAVLHYIEWLNSGDLARMLSLFSEDALVHSPLYGNLPAKLFYEQLFVDTQRSELTLLHIFSDVEKPLVYAANFSYKWILSNNTETAFDCVDIFVFDESNKIKELTIIYDTHATRQVFEKL